MYRFNTDEWWKENIRPSSYTTRHQFIKNFLRSCTVYENTYLIREGEPYVYPYTTNESYVDGTNVLSIFMPIFELLETNADFKLNYSIRNYRTRTLQDTKDDLHAFFNGNAVFTHDFRDPNTYSYIDIIVPSSRASTINSRRKIIEEITTTSFNEITIPEIVQGFKPLARLYNTERETLISQMPVRLFKHKEYNIIVRVSSVVESNAKHAFLFLLPVLFPQLKTQLSTYSLQALSETYKNLYIAAEATYYTYSNHWCSVYTHDTMKNIINQYVHKKFTSPDKIDDIVENIKKKLCSEQKSNILNVIEEMNTKIKELQNNISSYLIKQSKYYALLDSFSTGNDPVFTLIKELVSSTVVEDFNIKYNSISSRLSTDTDFETNLIVNIRTPLTNYEPDLAEIYLNRMIKNSEGQSRERIYKALKYVFVDQKAVMMTHAGISAGLISGSLTNTRYELETPNSIPNPHLMSFNCFGNTKNTFLELMRQKDYTAVLPVLTVCVANLNFADSTVVNHFLQGMLSDYRHVKAFKDMETGEMMSILEIYNKYKPEGENENESN